jgi:hypothetical protein
MDRHLTYFYSLSVIMLAAAIATVIFFALALPDRGGQAGAV